MRQLKISILMGFLFVLTSCANQEDLRPKRECPIEKLLLDKSDYPPDTILDSVHSPIAEEPLESAGLSAYPKDSWTGQLVIRHFSIEIAVNRYEETQKTIFHPNEVFGSWETPAALNLDYLAANRHNIACGNVNSFGSVAT
jgi:hypothetical protein